MSLSNAQLLAFVLSWLLIGCADQPPQDTRAADTASTSVAGMLPDDASQTGVELYDPGVNPDSVGAKNRFIVLGLRRLGRSLAEMTSALGPPDSMSALAVQNRHAPDQTDSLVTMHFKTARVTLYRLGSGRDLVSNITVYDNSLLLQPIVSIGMTLDEVIAKLGPPDPTADSEYRWSCSACVVDQQVILQLANRQVRSIGFEYYVD